MPRWESDPLIVLGARESRVQGEAAGQIEPDPEEHSLHAEAGNGCQRNWGR
jgi:hypothetical protein